MLGTHIFSNEYFFGKLINIKMFILQSWGLQWTDADQNKIIPLTLAVHPSTNVSPNPFIDIRDEKF
jgi:hypothetical protein